MNMYCYKGIVVRNSIDIRDEIDVDFTFICKGEDDEYKFLPILRDTEKYEIIDDYSVIFSAMKIFDGTENVSVKYGEDRKFEDILVTIDAYAKSDIEVMMPVIDILYDDDEGCDLMWIELEKVFEDEIIKEAYESFKGKSFKEIIKEVNNGR